tara:strand:+ start:117 stop:356 length:240 start_codon:yes stop_codon:yes gene_type:complete
MTNFLTAFDRRIDVTPDEWKGPLTQVMDTFDSVCLYFSDKSKEKWTPQLGLELTKLILERHDAEQKKLDEEAQLDLDNN